MLQQPVIFATVAFTGDKLKPPDKGVIQARRDSETKPSVAEAMH